MGARKRKKAVFDPSKIALRLKKVCYNVSLCENYQRQRCRVFIGLTIRAKIIGGGCPLLPEILDQSNRVGAKSPIFDLFSLVALQPYDLAKKVQLSLIGNLPRAFQWAQDEHRTLSLSPPKLWLKNAVSKIWALKMQDQKMQDLKTKDLLFGEL